MPRARPIDRSRHLRGLAGVDGASPLNRLLAANFHSYLHDDLLVKADRMSMANSLEARAPFLDTALMEYVAGAARRLQAATARTTKAILREAFADLVPDEVMSAAEEGIRRAARRLVPRELRDYVRDVLLSPSARPADLRCRRITSGLGRRSPGAARQSRSPPVDAADLRALAERVARLDDGAS